MRTLTLSPMNAVAMTGGVVSFLGVLSSGREAVRVLCKLEVESKGGGDDDDEGRGLIEGKRERAVGCCGTDRAAARCINGGNATRSHASLHASHPGLA